MSKQSTYIADRVTAFIGSWKFIGLQSAIILLWVGLSVYKVTTFDPYPYILLNLFLAFEAAYATPMILMASDREREKYNEQISLDLEIDRKTGEIVVDLTNKLSEMHEELISIREQLNTLTNK